MATIKQLLKSVEDEIKRRGITAKDAQAEIGVAGTAIYAWRKGAMPESAQEKITTWLPQSATMPAKDDALSENAAPPAIAKKGAKRRTPPASEREAVPLPGDLIERGEQLVQKLTEFGCEQHAATVSELVEKWRAVRSALSA